LMKSLRIDYVKFHKYLHEATMGYEKY
jgi:hypothetical protein